MASTSAELFQVLLAVFQGGWQYVALNTHLTAAELAYILGDSGATALFADADLADIAAAAADDAGVPSDGRIAIGGDIPGFTRFVDVLADHDGTTMAAIEPRLDPTRFVRVHRLREALELLAAGVGEGERPALERVPDVFGDEHGRRSRAGGEAAGEVDRRAEPVAPAVHRLSARDERTSRHGRMSRFAAWSRVPPAARHDRTIVTAVITGRRGAPTLRRAIIALWDSSALT